jgi:hypothetical protein
MRAGIVRAKPTPERYFAPSPLVTRMLFLLGLFTVRAGQVIRSLTQHQLLALADEKIRERLAESPFALSHVGRALPRRR